MTVALQHPSNKIRGTVMASASAILIALGSGIYLLPLWLHAGALAKLLTQMHRAGLVIFLVGVVMVALRQLQSEPEWEPVDLLDHPHGDRAQLRTAASARAAPDLSGQTGAAGVGSDPVIGPGDRPDAWSRQLLDIIEWRRFGAVVETLFAYAGFATRARPIASGESLEIWLSPLSQPGTRIGIVHCHHRPDRRVGEDEVRAFRRVMATSAVRRGQMVSSAGFTQQALEFARQNAVHTLDGRQILEMIQRRDPDQQRALLELALEGEYWRPTCARCSTKMMPRIARDGGKSFWVCLNDHAHCQTTLPMRCG